MKAAEATIKILGQRKFPGRQGYPQFKYLIECSNGKFYVIYLKPEFIRTKSDGFGTEVIYRCDVHSKIGSRLYTGFEHPDSDLRHFLRMAKELE